MPQSKLAFLASRESFEAFVHAWEACTLPKTEFTHAAHVAIGASYTVRFGEQALPRIREGIKRFNISVGGKNTETAGYHETLTRFWWLMLRKHNAGQSDHYESACSAVKAFGEQRKLYETYYGFDVAGSTVARQHWVAPDLREI